MTPLHVKILLHYYATSSRVYAADNRAHATASATVEYKSELCQWGLIEPTDMASEADYKITERGTVLVKAICNTPLPVQKWVMP